MAQQEWGLVGTEKRGKFFIFLISCNLLVYLKTLKIYETLKFIKVHLRDRS